jgi:Domain of unknown function (DUF1906)
MPFAFSCRLFASVAGAAVILVATACHEGRSITRPDPASGGLDSGNHPAFPGFDTSVYPGDVAVNAWKWPHSPYRWAGYYLGGPCHKDETWRGRYARLTADGWGVAAIYVGQQDWSQIPDLVPLMNRVDAPAFSTAQASLATCSASLLTDAQGRLEGQDAASRMAADGFPSGSTVFLDVEYVSAVNDALLTYVQGWVRGVLSDGRYRAGIYMARFNSGAVSSAARAGYTASASSGAPIFWIAATTSSLGFSFDSRPTDVGVDYASVWQGKLDVRDSWAGTQLLIDMNVASSMSPSSPGAAAQVVDRWGTELSSRTSEQSERLSGSSIRSRWHATSQ